MVVNGVNFNEDYAKSVTEAAFVKTFEKTSWYEAKGGEKFLREVHKKMVAKPKEEDVAKPEAITKEVVTKKQEAQAAK